MTHITSIEKQTDNRFLNMYHLTFRDRLGGDGNYYFCTRNSDENLKIRTHNMKADGICIYALTREKEPRLVLIREYRFPLDAEIYSLPAGLIDPGETPGQAAAREMEEETGLTFTEYTGGEAFCRRPFFLVPGFSDEPGCAIFGTVEGTPSLRENESTEYIQIHIADKAEVRRILSEERTSVRTAFLMWNYLNSSAAEPFRFLECREDN
ncbi:MAG: NUDIX hydrolase [Lachnospiraceae bacterium]|nr:NUDIX hydrolase [Lachnospiraceae bacterium]MDY6334918.1 NUDIX hydrolase [Lachnospiraceae bacterium]